jgi:hypothetical protein
MLHKMRLFLVEIFVLCLSSPAAAYGKIIALGWVCIVALIHIPHSYYILTGFDVRLHFHVSPS